MNHGCIHATEHIDEERCARVCDHCNESLGPIPEPDYDADSEDDARGDHMRDQAKDPDWRAGYDWALDLDRDGD